MLSFVASGYSAIPSPISVAAAYDGRAPRPAIS
jgi:hypothetical protein